MTFTERITDARITQMHTIIHERVLVNPPEGTTPCRAYHSNDG